MSPDIANGIISASGAVLGALAGGLAGLLSARRTSKSAERISCQQRAAEHGTWLRNYRCQLYEELAVWVRNYQYNPDFDTSVGTPSPIWYWPMYPRYNDLLTQASVEVRKLYTEWAIAVNCLIGNVDTRVRSGLTPSPPDWRELNEMARPARGIAQVLENQIRFELTGQY